MRIKKHTFPLNKEVAHRLVNNKVEDIANRKSKMRDYEVKLVWIHPSTFLAKSPKKLTPNNPALQKSLENMIQSHKPLPPLMLDFSDMWENEPYCDGRVKATVATKLKIKRIPVIMVKPLDKNIKKEGV